MERAPVPENQLNGTPMKNLLATAALALAFSPVTLADTTLDYDVLHFGKKSGAQTVVLRDGGRVHVTYSYRDNGRGPDIEEDIALLPDGTFGRYRQTGRTTYGAVLDERFSAKAARRVLEEILSERPRRPRVVEPALSAATVHGLNGST